MKPSKVSITIFFLGAAVSLGIFAGTAMGNDSPTADISNEDLVAFVDGAVTYANEVGKESALQEFNNASGQFVDGPLYIFANDFDGIALAHPHRPDFVGNNQIDLKDANEVAFFKNMVSVAKRDGGFVYYVFANPADDNKEELKLTYVAKIDDALWVGAGVYLPDISTGFGQESRDDLVNFVEEAAQYAKDNGKEDALEAFNDLEGELVRDGLYVFAYDFEGNTLALPYQPELIGTNRIDLQDPNSVKFVRDAADLAIGGSGFTYYVYPDPAEEMANRLKMSYVTQVDDTWWVGAGLYAR